MKTTNEVSTTARQLPDKIEDLTRFALIGREKLVAVRAEIRAIEKVGLAKEVHEQKLKEAQEIAEAVLDAEVRIGELLKNVPKATPNNNPFHEIPSGGELVKPKSEVVKEIGITHPERYEQLAAHPTIVEQAKAQARENGEVVSRTAVMRQIAAEAAQRPENKPKDNAVEAKLRHDTVKQADVISMDEIRQDKRDRHTIATEFYKDLLSITHKAITAAIWNSPDDIDDLMEVIPDDRWSHFCEQIDKTIYLLNRIKTRRTEWREKVSIRTRKKR